MLNDTSIKTISDTSIKRSNGDKPTRSTARTPNRSLDTEISGPTSQSTTLKEVAGSNGALDTQCRKGSITEKRGEAPDEHSDCRTPRQPAPEQNETSRSSESTNIFLRTPDPSAQSRRESFVSLDASFDVNESPRTKPIHSASIENPYTLSDGLNRIEIPTGNDPIPIGSGIITKLLGTGGMASVYKIWNGELEVYRALKLMHPSGNMEFRERFLTEIKISAKLHHPNLIEIYSTGKWKGLPYFEMDLIEGDTLEELLKKHGKVPPAIACAVALFVANALSYAHKHCFLLYGKQYEGVIHRDLKPGNVMIAGDGKIKLMDFGIARPNEVSIHTVNSENIVGTLQYFSPEQLQDGEVDFRTDIYSLGVILYEMLVGKNPFRQSNKVSLISMKLVNKYTPIEEYGIPLPKELVRIVDTCLMTDKQRRYASAGDLAGELWNAYTKLSPSAPTGMLQTFALNPQSFISHANIIPSSPSSMPLETANKEALGFRKSNVSEQGFQSKAAAAPRGSEERKNSGDSRGCNDVDATKGDRESDIPLVKEKSAIARIIGIVSFVLIVVVVLALAGKLLVGGQSVGANEAQNMPVRRSSDKIPDKNYN
ncbi:MAG: protein kinase [Chitinivibrionales bacterium]|nr:protein kinase [Chitinivibrionales bacterium]MBD3358003.1 protein kinase [Chitinivibrionales bacterium]